MFLLMTPFFYDLYIHNLLALSIRHRHIAYLYFPESVIYIENNRVPSMTTLEIVTEGTLFRIKSGSITCAKQGMMRWEGQNRCWSAPDFLR